MEQTDTSRINGAERLAVWQQQQSIGTNASMVKANVDVQKSDGLEVAIGEDLPTWRHAIFF